MHQQLAPVLRRLNFWRRVHRGSQNCYQHAICQKELTAASLAMVKAVVRIALAQYVVVILPDAATTAAATSTAATSTAKFGCQSL